MFLAGFGVGNVRECALLSTPAHATNASHGVTACAQMYHHIADSATGGEPMMDGSVRLRSVEARLAQLEARAAASPIAAAAVPAVEASQHRLHRNNDTLHLALAAGLENAVLE